MSYSTRILTYQGLSDRVGQRLEDNKRDVQLGRNKTVVHVTHDLDLSKHHIE